MGLFFKSGNQSLFVPQLSTYYVPGTVLGPEDIPANKTKPKIIAIMFSRWGKQSINKIVIMVIIAKEKEIREEG